MATMAAPDRSEAAEYYFIYIDQVRGDDICAVLEQQLTDMIALLRSIPPDQTLTRYAPGKWTMREVLGHLNDCERLFTFRAFWFARGFDSPLPSFDQHQAVATAGSNERSWKSLVGEFRVAREASIAFYRDLPGEAWLRRGVASGNPFTVRALAWLAAGHVTHHTKILRERYLV